MSSSFTRAISTLLVLLTLLLSGGRASGQVTLTGTVRASKSGEPIPMVSVVLRETADSTLLRGTITDVRGEYRMDTVPVGRYLLQVSLLGYTPYSETIRAVIPASGNEVALREIALDPSATDLEELVVTASRVSQLADHKAITFTTAQRKKASYARDLLKELPGIRLNAVTNRLTDHSGTPPLILINGIRATETELRTIPPSKVRRVDYYETPPARYAGVGRVIDVITYRLDDGLAGGGELLAAPSLRFANGSAYLAGNLGDHRIDLSYSLQHRNYRKRLFDLLYEYSLGGSAIADQSEGGDHFGYDQHRIDLKYSYSHEDKDILQVTLSPGFETRFAIGRQEGKLLIDDRESLRTERDKDDHTRLLTPTLDLYYLHKISPEEEWGVNLHGSLFRTSRELRQTETMSGKADYTDEMTLRNTKGSLISELYYSRSLLSGRLTAGYRAEYSRLRSRLSNLLGQEDFGSWYLRQYGYAQWSGARDSWLYDLSLGLTHLYNRSYSQATQRLLFTPRITLGYTASSSHTLRLIGTRAPIIPGLSQLSPNATMITRQIISEGNPDLHNGSELAVYLSDTYSSPHLVADVGLIYAYQDRPIEQYFRSRGDRISLTYRNGRFAHQVGGNIRAMVSLFDALTLQGSITPLWQSVHTVEGVKRGWSIDNFLSAGYAYKGLEINYQLCIPSYSIDGIFRHLSENVNDLMISYKYKGWKATAGMLFIGQDAIYRTETLPGALVRQVSNTHIRDNRSMIILGLEYNFSIGKMKSIDRKLTNRDTEAPTY